MTFGVATITLPFDQSLGLLVPNDLFAIVTERWTSFVNKRRLTASNVSKPNVGYESNWKTKKMEKIIIKKMQL